MRSLGRGSVTLLHVRSVPIRAHWTLLVILPYLAFVFSLRFAEAAQASGVEAASLSRGAIIGWGLAIALGLFVSIAVHELAHTFVAVRSGGKVRGITLMMLGGVSQIERLPKRPRNEALMAAAGPLTSFILAGLLFLLERAVAAPGLHIAVYYLARLNLILAVFNLLPAFPMDGGRILRALLAGRLGMIRATRIAAGVGKVAAVIFMILGALGGSVLIILIGFFLLTGAQFELHAYELRESLHHLRVADLMVSPAPAVHLDETVGAALERMRRRSRLDLLLVDGGVRGAIRAAELAPFDRSLRIGDLGLGVEVATARPDENAGEALERGAYLAVIEEDGSVVGLLGPGELEHAFALWSMAEPRRRQQPA